MDALLALKLAAAAAANSHNTQTTEANESGENEVNDGDVDNQSAANSPENKNSTAALSFSVL